MNNIIEFQGPKDNLSVLHTENPRTDTSKTIERDIAIYLAAKIIVHNCKAKGTLDEIDNAYDTIIEALMKYPNIEILRLEQSHDMYNAVPKPGRRGKEARRAARRLNR